MKLQDLANEISAIWDANDFPSNWEVGEDNDGQLVIYTGLIHRLDGELATYCAD
jgi:hypothetical protein